MTRAIEDTNQFNLITIKKLTSFIQLFSNSTFPGDESSLFLHGSIDNRMLDIIH